MAGHVNFFQYYTLIFILSVYLPCLNSTSLDENNDAYWPNGIIPFHINDDIELHQRHKIMMTVMNIASRTCLKFLPLAKEPHINEDVLYIEYKQIKTCIPHTNHYVPGLNKLTLGSDCLRSPALDLILLRVLGYSTRTETDVNVIFEEINENYKKICLRRDRKMEQKNCVLKRSKRGTEIRNRSELLSGQNINESDSSTFLNNLFYVLTSNCGFEEASNELIASIYKFGIKVLEKSKYLYCATNFTSYAQHSKYFYNEHNITKRQFINHGLSLIGNFVQKVVGVQSPLSENVPLKRDKNEENTDKTEQNKNKPSNLEIAKITDHQKQQELMKNNGTFAQDWEIKWEPATIHDFRRFAGKAVMSERDSHGSPICVIRASHTYKMVASSYTLWVPGYLLIHEPLACYAWTKLNVIPTYHTTNSFQMLTAPPGSVRWVPFTKGGQIPKGAIIAGRHPVLKDEPLYVGRRGHNYPHPGVVLSSALTYALEGKARATDNFEILCRSID